MSPSRSPSSHSQPLSTYAEDPIINAVASTTASYECRKSDTTNAT